MKKIISTTIITSLVLSSAAFAKSTKQSLSQIMTTQQAEIKTLGARIAIENSLVAVQQNNISKAEFDAYAKSEMGPSDYKKLTAAIAKNDFSDQAVKNLAQNLGQGANYESTLICNNNGKILITGLLSTAVAVGYLTKGTDRELDDRNKDIKEGRIAVENMGYDLETLEITPPNKNKIEMQRQIADLKFQGVRDDSYLIVEIQYKIDQIDRAEAKSKVDERAVILDRPNELSRNEARKVELQARLKKERQYTAVALGIAATTFSALMTLERCY